MRKAVIYARYSSGRQTEQSIEGQLRICHKYAEENDLTVIGEYVDRKKTGQNDRRPAFQKMLADSSNKDFEIVIVYALDRFARDDGDHGTDKKILQKNGVLLLSATQTIGINADGTENLGGILTEGIYIALAKYYSRELAQKVRRGQNESIEKKNFLGGNVPYGYYVKNKKLLIKEDEAEIVRSIFEWYSKNKSAKEIAKILNARHLTNSIGQKFKPNGIMRTLQNERYIGTFRYGERVFRNYHPAIIDETLFEAVQMKIQQNKRNPARAKARDAFILSGKFYCGYCKKPMVGESGTSRTGAKYFYYKCSMHKRGEECSLQVFKKKKIEDIVINATISHILNDNVINGITEQVLTFQEERRATSEIAVLQDELSQINNQLHNLVEAIKNGIFSTSTKDELQRLEKRKTEIEERVEQLKYKDYNLTEEHIMFWFEQFKTFDTEDIGAREYLVTYFINKIIAYNDKLVIIYNHNGNNRTDLGIDAIEAALGSDFVPLVELNTTKSIISDRNRFYKFIIPLSTAFCKGNSSEFIAFLRAYRSTGLCGSKRAKKLFRTDKDKLFYNLIGNKLDCKKTVWLFSFTQIIFLAHGVPDKNEERRVQPPLTSAVYYKQEFT